MCPPSLITCGTSPTQHHSQFVHFVCSFQVVVVQPSSLLDRMTLPLLDRFEVYLVGLNDFVTEMAGPEGLWYKPGRVSMLQYLQGHSICLLGRDSFFGLEPSEAVASILLSELQAAHRNGAATLSIPRPLRCGLGPWQEEDSASLEWEQQILRGTLFKLIQAMRPEMLVSRCKHLSPVYLGEYLHRQEHFSLPQILQNCVPRGDGRSADNGPRKLIIFTRTYPYLFDLVDTPALQHALLGSRYPDPVVASFISLSSIASASACQRAIREHLHDASTQAVVVVAELCSVTAPQLTLAQSCIDTVLAAGHLSKTAIMLVHFAPSQAAFGSPWEAVFLSKRLLQVCTCLCILFADLCYFP